MSKTKQTVATTKKVEVRYRYSSRGRNGFMVYVNGKFIKSYRTKNEAEIAKTELEKA